jgi:hypothetical protein
MGDEMGRAHFSVTVQKSSLFLLRLEAGGL